MDGETEQKIAKVTEKRVLKRELMFKNYKDCQSNIEIILKSQERFKSDHHKVYVEQINKIALSSNDDKRLQTFDKIKTYPLGTIAFKVCESDLLSKYKWLILMITQMKTKHNSKWPFIPDHLYKMLTIGGSGSGKTNVLLNLMNNQIDIDKIYFTLKIHIKLNINF